MVLFAEEAAERHFTFARPPVLVRGVGTPPVHAGGADHAGEAARGIFIALVGIGGRFGVTVPVKIGKAVVAAEAFCRAMVIGSRVVERHKKHLPAVVRAETIQKSTGNTNRVDIFIKRTLRDGTKI